MTVDGIIQLYVEHYVPTLVNARNITRMFGNHFEPLQGYDIERLTRFDVQRWYRAIGEQHPQLANECLSRLRHMLNWAMQELNVPLIHNPARSIKRFPEYSRTRFLSQEEAQRLWGVLESESVSMRLYFRLILLTAARRGEALHLQWIDLQDGVWHKRNTKTQRIQCVPLCDSLWTSLKQYRQGLSLPSPWVFAGKRGPWSIATIEKRWQVIRRKALIPDVRIHDLRRTTASWLAIRGENLSVIQAVLGHHDLQHTAIYARLTDGPVRRALEGLGSSLIEPVPPGPSTSPPARTRQ